MIWTRQGDSALRSGPWVIGRAFVEGRARYVLTRDGDTTRWGCVTYLNARVFDDAATAKAVAEEENGA